MYQIDNPSASSTLPASTAVGVPGFFTDGNPSTGVDPTILPAEFLNMVMMEIANTVTGAGFALSKTGFTQLKQAIGRYQQKTIVLADAGTANTYNAVNTPALVAGDLVTGLIQKISVLNTNTGASTYAPDGLAAKPIYGMGLAPLQGGELVLKGVAVLMYLIASTVNAGNGAWVVIECTGGAQQIAPGVNSQHALQVGQKGIQLFFGSGSFTVPAGVTKLVVSGSGGGGGGGGSGGANGGASFSASGGGGGGAAGICAIKQAITVTPGQVLTITVGAGGSAGTAGTSGGTAATNGGDGGSTTIIGTGVSLSLNGGAGGKASAYAAGTNVGLTGGAGGVPSGTGGGVGYAVSGYAFNLGGTGGVGGASPFGLPGGGVVPSVAGNAGSGFGTGGGGAGGVIGGTINGFAGGAGMAGIVIIEW